jgi:signal transduction histidine kinase
MLQSKGYPRGVSEWVGRYRGRFEVEVVLAFVVGVAAFALAALVSAAARSHVPSVLLGAFFILVVVVVARYGGILYALPVGVVSLQAFDWYFLPPLRDLDTATLFVLALFLLMSVLVGAIAVAAGRRAAASEGALNLLADEQAALRRVATLVAQHASPSAVFAAVTEEVGRLLHLDLANLYVYEGDGTGTVIAAWSRQGAHFPVGMRLSFESDSVAARAFRTQRPARMDNFEQAEGATAEFVRSFGVRSSVGTPIVVEGRFWGLMTAGSMQPEPLPAGTEWRIAEFTELVATAISNAEARQELERVAGEQAALGRVATLVAEAVPSREVFAAVAAEVAGLFSVPLVGLFRYETASTATLIAGSGKLSPYLGRSWNFPADDQSLLATLQRTGRPLRVDDYSKVTGAGVEIANELDVGAAVGVPVIVDGRVWGAVALGVANDRPPLPTDTVDRVTDFTDLIGTAIANAEARTEVGRLAEEQAALRRVATLVARGVQPGEAFAAVAEEIGRVLAVETTIVVRYEADATATIVATWGDETLWPLGSNWSLEDESVVSRVFYTGHSAGIHDYGLASGEFASSVGRVARLAGVGAPIIIDDRLWGAAVATAGSRPLPTDAEERIANFADLIATAISNAETRTELTVSRARVVAAGDETRRRLERDLHDGIQQRLVSLALKAHATEAMQPQPSQEVREELSLLADGIGDALDELREISRGIHPAIVSEAGLGPALKSLARRSAVPVTLDLKVDSPLAQTVEVAAYYVASEALTNAVKHAKATGIELYAECNDGAVTLLIRDDGVGGVDPSRGSGILGLRDRVEALGGAISIVSPVGEGTTVQVDLPADPGSALTPEVPGADADAVATSRG